MSSCFLCTDIVWAVDIRWPVLAVISAGGALGALARYGLGVAFPHTPGQFPWATFAVNVSGCLFIGVLLVVIGSQRLLRPFLGTGFLGGYTTFSTYIVDIQHLLGTGKAVTAFAYLAGTLVSAMLAVYLGFVAARATLIRGTA